MAEPMLSVMQGIPASSIHEQLLSSKRVLPIDMKRKVIGGARNSTIPKQKITMLEDSTVSIRPPRLTHEQAAKRRYRSTNRRNPVLSVSNVHEKDRVQNRRLDELLLSHADTLTRSGSSKQFLPIINSPVANGATNLTNQQNEMQIRKIDKYFTDA